MTFVLLLLCLTMTFVQLTSQHQSTDFSVVRGLKIRTESKWTSYQQVSDVSSAATCALVCLSKENCGSALYNKSTSECQLSLCRLDLYIIDKKSDLTYLQIGNVLSEGKVDLRSGNRIRYIDCQEAFEDGHRCSGIFQLYQPNTATEFEAYCEFDEEHGWTVIQRRLDGSVDFYRGWDDYVNGFGDLSGEYWLGLENIYYLTTSNRELSVYLEDHEGHVRGANYSTFYIGDSSTDYILTATGYSGDAEHSLTTGGYQFSTKDNDNDVADSSCAVSYTGAWWYSACHSSNLNGFWYPANISGGDNAPYAGGVVWRTWRGYYYSLKAVTMRVTR